MLSVWKSLHFCCGQRVKGRAYSQRIISPLAIMSSKPLCLIVINILYCLLNPLPDNDFQTLPKDNFIFDENGRKLSKSEENAVGKEEIACYKQFLLFPQCFQKACFPEASKGVIVWEWVKGLVYNTL